MKVRLPDLEFLYRQHRAAKKRSSFEGKRIGIYAGTFNPRNVQWTFSVDTREPSL